MNRLMQLCLASKIISACRIGTRLGLLSKPESDLKGNSSKVE